MANSLEINMAVSKKQLVAVYQTIAELLLYPEDRDADRVANCMAELSNAPAPLVEGLREFFASPRSGDSNEYIQVLELSPPCPLYLGSYMFDEPKSCLGAGLSGRNGYMMELAGAYRHFGFEIGKGELTDFVPAMAEFLAISLDNLNLDTIGLRRRFVESYVKPGLEPMRKALAKYDSPYGLIIGALEAAVDEDIALHADGPMWKIPPRVGKPPTPPVISFGSNRTVAPAGDPI